MPERSLRRDIATIGVGIGLPVTFVVGAVLLLVTAFTGRVPLWVLLPFVALALVSGASYLALRRLNVDEPGEV
jgi:hypothetical protein